MYTQPVKSADIDPCACVGCRLVRAESGWDYEIWNWSRAKFRSSRKERRKGIGHRRAKVGIRASVGVQQTHQFWLHLLDPDRVLSQGGNSSIQTPFSSEGENPGLLVKESTQAERSQGRG